MLNKLGADFTPFFGGILIQYSGQKTLQGWFRACRSRLIVVARQSTDEFFLDRLAIDIPSDVKPSVEISRQDQITVVPLRRCHC